MSDYHQTQKVYFFASKDCVRVAREVFEYLSEKPKIKQKWSLVFVDKIPYKLVKKYNIASANGGELAGYSPDLAIPMDWVALAGHNTGELAHEFVEGPHERALLFTNGGGGAVLRANLYTNIRASTIFSKKSAIDNAKRAQIGVGTIPVQLITKRRAKKTAEAFLLTDPEVSFEEIKRKDNERTKVAKEYYSNLK
ncbi:MAG: hypothetical protein FWE50_03070 [Alphaproteobacteria bacterium]|nr:hypothetical protein [Alphaproteobacteria bacterium]